MSIDELRYPVGTFQKPEKISQEERQKYIYEISVAPSLLRKAVSGLDNSQLDTPYREGGWTIRQVVHHLPDSHINAYMRFKLALTENNPLIRTYEESLWAELPEAKTAPIDMSLFLLESLHKRWVSAMQSIPNDAFNLTYRHPESGLYTLDQQIAMYAWHGKHHIAQITGLITRMNW